MKENNKCFDKFGKEINLRNFRVGPQMSNPICYTTSMKIEKDMKYEIRPNDNWFAIYPVGSSSLRNVGGPTIASAEKALARVLQSETPAGLKATQERSDWADCKNMNRWTGD